MCDESDAEDARAAVKAVKELEDCARNMDTEQAHVEADRVLCSFLTELGWENVVEAFKKVPRWYA